MTIRHEHFILDGHRAVPVDLMTWSEWFSKADRRVANTEIGDVRVSTVFLGLNHQWEGGGPPEIFETLVFGGDLDQEMERYSTWEQAEAGHAAMVERVKMQ